MRLTRRDCLKVAGLGAGALLLPGRGAGAADVPRYLRDHATAYARDPRRAARDWFAEARYGLFLHYGVYSLLARGEWVMLQEAIPLAEYSKLKDRFSYMGSTYRVKEMGAGTIKYIEGEFPYHAEVGDVILTLDAQALSSRSKISATWTKTELEWLSVKSLSPYMVKRAFGITHSGASASSPFGASNYKPHFGKASGTDPHESIKNVVVLLFIIGFIVEVALQAVHIPAVSELPIIGIVAVRALAAKMIGGRITFVAGAASCQPGMIEVRV